MLLKNTARLLSNQEFLTSVFNWLFICCCCVSYCRVVYPELENNGGYVKPLLHNYCQGSGYRYNELKDACEKK